MVRGFLPEVFFEREHEAIRAILTLRRSVHRPLLGLLFDPMAHAAACTMREGDHASSIIFKADLVTKHIDQTYRIDASLKNGAAANPDELAAACQV